MMGPFMQGFQDELSKHAVSAEWAMSHGIRGLAQRAVKAGKKLQEGSAAAYGMNPYEKVRGELRAATASHGRKKLHKLLRPMDAKRRGQVREWLSSAKKEIPSLENK